MIQGEPVVGGLHGPGGSHFHCPWCMSWMFTRAEGIEGFVNLRPTMLDAPRWDAPFVESWTREKLPWVGLPAQHGYPEFPPMEEYQRLVEAYQAQVD